MSRHEVGSVFAALADATRRDVVLRLAAQGSATATELAAGLPISRQGVSKHLLALEQAGLVSARRSGREVHYRLDPAPLTDAVSWVASVGASWDARLDALARHASVRPGRAGH